ncbi:MAG TPA: ALF repeat-containing protein [Catenuloplanes sp.]|jgi:hypothetical protein
MISITTWQVTARTVGAATALTLAVGLGVPGMAFATPATTGTNAVTRLAALGASLQEKAAAIRALEIEPLPTLTGLPDCGLATALWERLEGKAFRAEVRAAAQAAFAGQKAVAGDITECTAFIRTGIHEAKARDVAIEQRVREEQRAERELKQQAAQTVAIVADEAMLALTVREFIWAIRNRATGPKVKAAAEAAFNGTDADRQAFLGTGIANAHEEDRRKEIEDRHENDLAEQKRLLEEAARKRALAILLIDPTPAMLQSADRDFVTYLWEHARPGSEVRAAAEKAVLNRDPAVWNAYIHTGVREAHDEDIAIALRKKQEADRAQAEAVLAQATADGHLNLVHATRKALAGSPTDLDDFLRKGQYDLDLKTSFEAGEIPLNWKNSAASEGSISNVNGCSLTDAKRHRDAVAEISARIGALTARFKLTTNAAEKARLQVQIRAAQAQLVKLKAGYATCVSLPTELEVNSETGHTGSAAIRYFGVDHDAKLSFAYLKAMNLSRITVKPTTTLSYWIYPQANTTRDDVIPRNSSCVAVDLKFSDGRTLRDSGAKDQRGNVIHPAQQCGKLQAERWTQVVVPLGELFRGKNVTGLNVGYDQPANTGAFRGYIDDITITDEPITN